LSSEARLIPAKMTRSRRASRMVDGLTTAAFTGTEIDSKKPNKNGSGYIYLYKGS